MPTNSIRLPVLPQIGLVLALIFPSLAQGLNSQACPYIAGFESYCSFLTPNFLSLAPTNQASCLCYVSASWAPDNYDSIFGSCVNYLATSLPDVLANLTSAAGHPPITTPCRSIGNVRNAPVFDTNRGACQDIATFATMCAGVSSGFHSLPFPSQAPCFCYSQKTWMPQSYDSLWNNCLSYFKTATDPSIRSGYTSRLSLDGGVIATAPCAAVGNVLGAPLAPSTSLPGPAQSASQSQ